MAFNILSDVVPAVTLGRIVPQLSGISVFFVGNEECWVSDFP